MRGCTAPLLQFAVVVFKDKGVYARQLSSSGGSFQLSAPLLVAPRSGQDGVSIVDCQLFYKTIMVDASALIDALGQDDLDQAAVADHMVILAKVRNTRLR